MTETTSQRPTIQKRPVYKDFYKQVRVLSEHGYIYGKLRCSGRIKERFGIKYGVQLRQEDQTGTAVELSTGLSIGPERELTEELAARIKQKMSELPPEKYLENVREVARDWTIPGPYYKYREVKE